MSLDGVSDDAAEMSVPSSLVPVPAAGTNEVVAAVVDVVVDAVIDAFDVVVGAVVDVTAWRRSASLPSPVSTKA